MDATSRKNSLKKFKTKVIAKLYGRANETESEEENTDDDKEENVTETKSGSQLISDNDLQQQIHNTRVYGVHPCPNRITQTRDMNWPAVQTPSPPQVNSSNDEQSECDEVQKKRRKRRRGRWNGSQGTEQHHDTTTSGSNFTKSKGINTLSSLTLTKNQKRKLKKKRKDKEKRSDSSLRPEFIYDPSKTL